MIRRPLTYGLLVSTVRSRSWKFIRLLSSDQFSRSQPDLTSSSFYSTDPIDPDEKTFDKILVANRGEIAVRVMRTARLMGVKTVAIHSDIDSKSCHVRAADESVCVGTAQARDSYLDMDRVLEAVKSTGAQAVHPGYGFLSENAEFVRRLEQEGVAFIGPGVSAINGMGDKIQSKKLAIEAGVNTIPGFDGEISTGDQCVEVSHSIGYPVMIKASAGGGGKGMRIARNDEEALSGFRLSQQEALSSFGDGRILVEKFIDQPRHIEIQVLADCHGNAVYLNERECSIQRRNQKVIEEAPSVFIDEETRRAMGQQAVALARKIGYTSAGTVEFLVDSSKQFYFLEMNTRLQVEHPITECITGIDIVHQMLRIAKGHKLRIQQSDVPLRGWAIESRIYAEDPFRSFGLPSVGRLLKYQEPSHLGGVRCDSGVTEGSEISFYYDPMICKLVSYGTTRQQAIDRNILALDSYVIRGVTHNIPLLRDILKQPRFVGGEITTNFLPEVYPDGFQGHSFSSPTELYRLAALCAVMHVKRVQKITISSSTAAVAVTRPYEFVVVVPAQDPLWCRVVLEGGKDDRHFLVKLSHAESFEPVLCCLSVRDNFHLSQLVIEAEVDGSAEIVQLVQQSFSDDVTVCFRGTNQHVQFYSAAAFSLLHHMPVTRGESQADRVLAPMPGLVRTLAVAPGDTVSAGQEVCVVEAMKMQNSLTAPRAGVIREVHISEGDAVDENQVLVQLE